MRLKNLSVQDFRSFGRFKLKNLGQVNLLVGTNNCGKTTLLEAVNILMATGDFAAIWLTLLRRGEDIYGERDAASSSSGRQVDIRRLFRGHEIEVGNYFQLSADTDFGSVEMVAKIDENRPRQQQLFDTEMPIVESAEDFLPPLSLSLHWSHGAGKQLTVPISRGGISSDAIRRSSGRFTLGEGFPIRLINVQIIATTHSWDCCHSLAVICRDHVSDGSDVTISRIERGREEAIGYTEQEIVAAADRDIEVLIMAKQNPNPLLVEGKDEQYTLPFFMDEYVVWGDKKEDRAVEIKELNGVDNLLKPGVIEAESKTPGLSAIGVTVDANDSFDSRWARVRERCRRISSGFPDDLSSDGIIHVRPDGLRIGVWVMPDNRSHGMLETFLSFLLIPERLNLWSVARESCDRASGIEGCYAAAHRDKAHVHTYLAWVEPPGLSLPYSILLRAFDARLPLAEDFARWFMNLFQLPRRPNRLP